MDLSEVKIILRGLLISCKDGLTVMQLLNDFKSEEGIPVPFKDFGFDNIIDFLLSIPDVLMFQRNSNPHMGSILLPVHSSNTSHIAELVAGQKSSQKKRAKSVPRHRFYDNFNSYHNSYSQSSASYNAASREQTRWPRSSSRPYVNTSNRTSGYQRCNLNEQYSNSRRSSEEAQDSKSRSKSTYAPQHDTQEKENEPRSRPYPRSRSSPNHLEYKSDKHETDVTAKTPKHDNLPSENSVTNAFEPKQFHTSASPPSAPNNIVCQTTPNSSNSQLTSNVPPTSNSQAKSDQIHSSVNQSTSKNPDTSSSSNPSVSKFLSQFTQKPPSAQFQSKILDSLTMSPQTQSLSAPPPPVQSYHQGSQYGAAVFNSVPNPIQDGSHRSEPRYLQPLNPNVLPNAQYYFDQLRQRALTNQNMSQNAPKPLLNVAHSIQHAPWNNVHLNQPYSMPNMNQHVSQPGAYSQSHSSQQAPSIPLSNMHSPQGPYVNQQVYRPTPHLTQQTQISNVSNTNKHSYSHVPNMIQPIISQQNLTQSHVTGGPGLDLSYVLEQRLRRSSSNSRPPPGYENFAQPLLHPRLYPQHSLNSQGNQRPASTDISFDIPIPGDVSVDSSRCLSSRPPSVPISSSLRSASNDMLASSVDNPDEAYVKSLLESSAHEEDSHSHQPKQHSSSSESKTCTVPLLEPVQSAAEKRFSNTSTRNSSSRPASATPTPSFTSSTPTPSLGHASSSTGGRVDREIQFVGKRMRENLIALMAENPEGIRCALLPSLYETKYEVPLNYKDYGTPSVFSFVEKLPTVFKIVDMSSGEDWMLFDPDKEVPAEYLRRDLIPEAIEEALLKILRRCRNGFFLDEFTAKYEIFYRRPINLKDYPAFSWGDVVAHCTVAKKLAKAQLVGTRWFFRPLSKDAHLQPEHNVPAIPPEWELLKPQIAHYESTFVLKMDQLSKVELPDISKFEEVPIILQDGLSPHNLSAILFSNVTALNEMMDDLNEVYNALADEELQMETVHITRGNICVARYSSTGTDGDWHRCKILRVLNDDKAKLLFLDFGTVGYAPCDQLKYMTRDYSMLPLQCIFLSLYRVNPVTTDPQTGLPVWDRKGLDKLLIKYENVKVNATVFQYNTKEPRITCWITALDPEGNVVELNKEFCDWGFGVLDLSSVPSTMQTFEEIPIPGDDDFQEFLDRISRPPSVDPVPDSDEMEEDNSAANLYDKPALKKKIFSSDSGEEDDASGSVREAKVPPVLSSILKNCKARTTVPTEDKILNIPPPEPLPPTNKKLKVPPVYRAPTVAPLPSYSALALPAATSVDYASQHRLPPPVMPVAPSSQNTSSVTPVASSNQYNPGSSLHYPSQDPLPAQQPTHPVYSTVASPNAPSINHQSVVPVDAQLMEVTYMRRDGFQVTEKFVGDHRFANQQLPSTSRNTELAHYQSRSNRLSLDNHSDDSSSDTDRSIVFDRGPLSQALTSVPMNNNRSVVPNPVQMILPTQLSNPPLSKNHMIGLNPVQLSNQHLKSNSSIGSNPSQFCNPLLDNHPGGALTNAAFSNLSASVPGGLEALLINIVQGVSKKSNNRTENVALNNTCAAMTAKQPSDLSGSSMSQNINQESANLSQVSQGLSRLSVRSNENRMESIDILPPANKLPLLRNKSNEQNFSNTSWSNRQSSHDNINREAPPDTMLSESVLKNAILAGADIKHHMPRENTSRKNAILDDTSASIQAAKIIDMAKENENAEAAKRNVYKAALHAALTQANTPSNHPIEKNLYYAGVNTRLDIERTYNMKTENINEPLRRHNGATRNLSSHSAGANLLNTQPSMQNFNAAPSLIKEDSVSTSKNTSQKNNNIATVPTSSVPYRPPHYHLHSSSSDLSSNVDQTQEEKNCREKISVNISKKVLNENNPQKNLNENIHKVLTENTLQNNFKIPVKDKTLPPHLQTFGSTHRNSSSMHSNEFIPRSRNSLNVNSDEFIPKNRLHVGSEEFVPEQVSTMCKLNNFSRTQEAQANISIQNIIDPQKVMHTTDGVHSIPPLPNVTSTINNKKTTNLVESSYSSQKMLITSEICGKKNVLNNVEPIKSDTKISDTFAIHNERPIDANPIDTRTKAISNVDPPSQISTEQTKQLLTEFLKPKTCNTLEKPTPTYQSRKPSTASLDEASSVKSDEAWAVKSKCKYFVNIRRIENLLSPDCEDYLSLRAVVMNKTALNVVVLGCPPRSFLIVEQFAHHILKASSVNVLLKTLRSQDQESILVKYTREGNPSLFERLARFGKLPKELENSLYLMEVNHVRSNFFRAFRKDLTALQEELAKFFT